MNISDVICIFKKKITRVWVSSEERARFVGEWSIDELHKIRTLRSSSIRVTALHGRSTSRKRGSPATHNFAGQWRESRRSNRSAKIPRNVRGCAYNSRSPLHNQVTRFKWDQKDLRNIRIRWKGFLIRYSWELSYVHLFINSNNVKRYYRIADSPTNTINSYCKKNEGER